MTRSKKTGVRFFAYNGNALTAKGIQEILDGLEQAIGEEGKVRMLLHSIAYGVLKLLAPEHAGRRKGHEELMRELSEKTGLESGALQAVFDDLFARGAVNLTGVASPPQYSSERLLEDDDFAMTIYSMGSSLATWVRVLFLRGMFAPDARILGLTSEGNEISWKGYAAVSAAKVTLEAITRAIAVEYAPYGIRANVIQAGVTDTPALRAIPGSEHMKATAQIRNPFNRLTKPEDVANFIYLMCLDEAAWANGNIIRLDGGEHISG